MSFRFDSDVNSILEKQAERERRTKSAQIQYLIQKFEREYENDHQGQDS